MQLRHANYQIHQGAFRVKAMAWSSDWMDALQEFSNLSSLGCEAYVLSLLLPWLFSLIISLLYYPVSAA
jgi:hypothetical protein